MKKNEFLEMMWQDIETEKEPLKTLYAEVIDCMEIALSQTPNTYEIPADKTVKDAWELIQKHGKDRVPQEEIDKARQSREPISTCVGPFEAAEIIAEYLGTKYERASKRFAAKPAVPSAAINLEDFI